MTSLVGVDGCKAGWIAVCERDGQLSVELWPSLDSLFSQPWTMACVDIPIGLKGGNGRRVCDQKARDLLGTQRSSIFYAPPRQLLSATDYEEVRKEGMSLQTFYLLPKIREMDQRIEPEDQRWLKEAHPELSFRTRSERLLHRKKSPSGKIQRTEILKELDSPFQIRRWESGFLRRDVAIDDLLDAAVLLEVAREWSWGDGQAVGDQERDSRGLKMEICF